MLLAVTEEMAHEISVFFYMKTPPPLYDDATQYGETRWKITNTKIPCTYTFA